MIRLNMFGRFADMVSVSMTADMLSLEIYASLFKMAFPSIWAETLSVEIPVGLYDIVFGSEATAMKTEVAKNIIAIMIFRMTVEISFSTEEVTLIQQPYSKQYCDSAGQLLNFLQSYELYSSILQSIFREKWSFCLISFNSIKSHQKPLFY